MAVVTPVPAIFFPTNFIPSTAALLFAAAGTNGAIIKKASFVNLSTSSPVQLTLWRLPNGTVATANALIVTPAIVIAPNDLPYTAQELINMVLENGDSIWAQCPAANTLTGTISGWLF